jgi:ribosome maturation factor RimP
MGHWPIFCFWPVLFGTGRVADAGAERLNKAPPHLQALVDRAVTALDYELVGVELIARPKAGHLLRVYIDGPTGIGLGDCERVSHQISGLFDVEDPIKSDYALEVSSPGLDRPLFEPAHFSRFVGEVVRVKLQTAMDGRSNYKGVIRDVVGDEVIVEVDGEPVSLPFTQIASARLVPAF